MSRIDNLIAKLSPNGVPLVSVFDIADYVRGVTYNKNDEQVDGPVQVLRANNITLASNTLNFDAIKRVSATVRVRDNQRLRRGDILICAGSGSKAHIGKVAFIEHDLLQTFGGFMAVLRSRGTVDPRYLFHALTGGTFARYLESALSTTTINNLNIGVIRGFRVPVPPLEVQREIVRILDQFTQLEAELEAELEARRVQYDHYRDTQLSFPESTPRVLLGNVGSIFGGLTGKTKADFANGNARFVSYINVFNNIAVNTRAEDFVQVRPSEKQRSLQCGDIIFTGSSETPDEVGMSSVVTIDVNEPLYLNSFCIGFRPTDNDLIDPGFAKHLFRSGEMRKQIVRTASGVTRFNVSKARLAKVEIPIPPKEEQRRLAHILDNFDALVNDLSTGLPAELRARRKQYEYYRDKLLTFEELPA